VPIKTYKDRNVYKEAHKLALDVSRFAGNFRNTNGSNWEGSFVAPGDLSRQILSRGWAKRASAPEFKRYLMVAIGSCDESKFWLELSRDEGYANAVEADVLANRFNLVGAMLKSLWKNWKNFAN